MGDRVVEEVAAALGACNGAGGRRSLKTSWRALEGQRENGK